MAKRVRRRTETPGPRTDVLDVLRSIWEINHYLQTASKRMSKQLGITGPQRLALRMIAREPDMPTLRLSALLHLDPSTVTGILDRMERDGLVARIADIEDGRRNRLQLTARGRRMNQVRSGTVESAVASAINQLSPATLGAGRELLNALCGGLQHLASGRSTRRAPRGRAPSRGARDTKRRQRHSPQS
jgi:DNA-binding MarR family transcriptional regulator